jgi:nicotinamidase-related amidase
MNKLLKNTALLICDLQTKSIRNLFYRDKIIKNVNKLLEIKTVSPSIKFSSAVEFIPDKLGHISPSINMDNIDYVYNKTTYSMVDISLLNKLETNEIDNVILTGMELHWCINSTLIDLSSHNYDVFIPIDAVGNRLSDKENTYNIENLKNNGANILTTDGLICQQLINYDDTISKVYVDILKKQ